MNRVRVESDGSDVQTIEHDLGMDVLVSLSAAAPPYRELIGPRISRNARSLTIFWAERHVIIDGKVEVVQVDAPRPGEYVVFVLAGAPAEPPSMGEKFVRVLSDEFGTQTYSMPTRAPAEPPQEEHDS